jgi:hypothetical protein
MATQERVFLPANRVQRDAGRRAGIPWWALLCTVILVLVLLSIWSTPIWADFSRDPFRPARDEIPEWVITLLILGALVGIKELATTYRR